MVNLTFCRLDSAYSINSDNSEAQHLFPFFISLSAGRSSLLEFRFDLLSLIRFGAFQMHLSFRSSAFGLHFQERSTFSLIWGRISGLPKIMDHDSDLLDAVGIMKDFFKQPQASVQIEATWSLSNFSGFFWSIRQILFTSVPLYYFDAKSDWLPCFQLYLGVHQRIYCLGISSLCL